jgi:hypothetical protein
MPGIASVPVMKILDEAQKRTKMMHQRIQIILRAISKIQKQAHQPTNLQQKSRKALDTAVKRLLSQHPHLTASIHNAIHTCEEMQTERTNHIEAIQQARNKKLYDTEREYQTEVLEQQGWDAYEHYIRSVKQTVLGIDSTQTTEADNRKKAKGHQKIPYYLPAWNEISHRVQTIMDENQVQQR